MLGPKYLPNQKVLCRCDVNIEYFYAATIKKVMKSTKTKYNGGNGSSGWSYLVHYIGWNSKWDRWVVGDENANNDIIEDTYENRNWYLKRKVITHEANHTTTSSTTTVFVSSDSSSESCVLSSSSSTDITSKKTNETMKEKRVVIEEPEDDDDDDDVGDFKKQPTKKHLRKKTTKKKKYFLPPNYIVSKIPRGVVTKTKTSLSGFRQPGYNVIVKDFEGTCHDIGNYANKQKARLAYKVTKAKFRPFPFNVDTYTSMSKKAQKAFF